MKNNRFTLKFGGESGQGINSIGEILVKALKRSGYKVFGYREYPSLIQGGVASYQIDISNHKVYSPNSETDLLICISRSALSEYLKDAKEESNVVHSINKPILSKEDRELIDSKKLKLHYINAEQEAILQGGTTLQSNVVLLGVIWKLLSLDIEKLGEVVVKRFGKNEKYLSANKKALSAGYSMTFEDLQQVNFKIKPNHNWSASLAISGNYALALGAYAAGMRAIYAYPMTPATSIYTYLSKIYSETGILMKQAEDEITAAQMALGSMFMGTRALTTTSGGGFDLMSETLSLSGMTETPFVTVIAQRPGPSTGVPTWSSSSDLNLAVYSGHGEYPRVVIAASDAKSSFTVIQDAFNHAEKYQIPVLVLTDKYIAESLFNIDELPQSLKITRGLVEDINSIDKNSRYAFTETGVSSRWLPGQSDVTYDANSDEHTVDGSSTENAEAIVAMTDKRNKKLEVIKRELPEPVIYGDKEADISFIGWGSVKTVMLDAIKESKEHCDLKVNYLHYEFVYPINEKPLKDFVENSERAIVIENNSTAQLRDLIRTQTGISIDETLLKYDGRPFYIDEVIKYICKKS